MNINTMAFAARDFSARRGVSDEHQPVNGFTCVEWPARARPTAPEAGALPKTTALLAKLYLALLFLGRRGQLETFPFRNVSPAVLK